MIAVLIVTLFPLEYTCGSPWAATLTEENRSSNRYKNATVLFFVFR